MRAPARMDRPTRNDGGFIFAEHPDVQAPDARILWHADLDPEVLPLSLRPACSGDPDAFDPARWTAPVTLCHRIGDREHLLLSDGFRRIRLDIVEGSLAMPAPLRPHFHLEGMVAARGPLRALGRFLDFATHGRFRSGLYPSEPRMTRALLLLQVHDALIQGASHRDIGVGLFGSDHVAGQWDGPSDALRSRVRRLVRDAGMLARGGYRDLLRRAPEKS